MTSSILRSPAIQTLFCAAVASCILLPALHFNKFPLAITVLIGLSLAFLLFTRPLYALLGYVVMIPLEQIAVFQALGTPTRIVGILFFAAYLFHRRFQLNLRVMPVAAWLWLAWVTASLIWSPIFYWPTYFQTLQAFIATLLIADYLARSPKHLNTILNAYLTVSVALSALAIYNFIANVGGAANFTASTRTEGFEGQGVEHFAFGLIPALYTAFHRLWRPEYRHLRWLNLSIILMFVTSIILSGTRGAWLATLGGLLLVYLPKFTFRQFLAFVLTLSLGAGIALQIPAVTDFARYRAQDAISSGGSGRVGIWLVSWQVYLQHPMLGVGWWMTEKVMDVSHLERVPTNITWDNDGSDRFRPRITHNIYLQVLVELGIVGFILYLTWLIKLLVPLLSRSQVLKDERTLVLGIIVALLVGGLTNPEFHKKYYWFALALAHGVSYYYLQIRQSKPTL